MGYISAPNGRGIMKLDRHKQQRRKGIIMHHRTGIGDDIPLGETNAFLHVDSKNMRPKYETLSPEAFLERIRNADRILENCRRDL